MSKDYYKKGAFFLNIILLFSVVIAIIVFFQKKTVCSTPLKYSIGTIDEKFNISKKDFIKVASSSERVWEEGMGMNLFDYDPDAKFKINLIFDDRQQKTILERISKEKIGKENIAYRKLESEYKALKDLYSKKFKEYNSSVSAYENKLKEYNKKVTFWNNAGNIDKEEFNKLELQRNVLKAKNLKLSTDMSRLKDLNKKINVVVDKINNFGNGLNSDVDRYNNTFGKADTFEQGKYTGDRINIYQFNTKKDLEVVVAHELGHALNLNHVKNSKSIMYPIVGKQDMDSPKLSTEDIEALDTECGISS